MRSWPHIVWVILREGINSRSITGRLDIQVSEKILYVFFYFFQRLFYLDVCCALILANLAVNNTEFFRVNINGLWWLEERGIYTSPSPIISLPPYGDSKYQTLRNLPPYALQQAHHRRSSFQGICNNILIGHPAFGGTGNRHNAGHQLPNESLRHVTLHCKCKAARFNGFLNLDHRRWSHLYHCFSQSCNLNITHFTNEKLFLHSLC